MTDIELDKVDQLSEENVFDILKFAEALGGGSIYPSVLTPMLLNQRLKEINNNPLQATEDSLAAALRDPKNNEAALQSFSQDFEDQSQVYKRLIDYLANMLSFDWTYECLNAKPFDYTSKAYQKDLDQLKMMMDRFDYKKEFGIATREMIRNEAFFCSARFDDEKYALQELNASPTYTMITGRSAYTLLFSFNMYFFIQPGVDISMFPRFFKEKYRQLWGDGKAGGIGYMPALPPEMRGNSSWVYWQDVPTGVDPFGWVFKLNPENASRNPYFAGLFSDLIQQSMLRSLQKNINMSVASRMLAGEIPMLKDTSAKVKDQFSITPGTLGNFLAYVKSAIGESLKAVALPLTNLKPVEFSASNDVYSSAMRNTVAMSGINSNLIFTNQNRTNAIESQLSVGIDEALVTKLYCQFDSFINYHVNRNTKNYKFALHFEGTTNYTNRQQRYDKVTNLFNLGICLPQKLAASMGMSPLELQRQMEESKATGFTDLLTPIVSAFQQGATGAKEGGRPQKSDSEISDSGAQARGDGGNISKGGKI